MNLRTIVLTQLACKTLFVNVSKIVKVTHLMIYVTIFGRTGLHENRFVMHFQCISNG